MGQVKQNYFSSLLKSKIQGYGESDYAELASILMDGAHSYGCSRLHFDTREELEAFRNKLLAHSIQMMMNN